jgi:hypothetical protein
MWNHTNTHRRNNIAAARLAGLEEDLNLDEDGTQFSVRSAQNMVFLVLI